ncbi:46479_t:CDS:1, partial [Gigaspora margarita]
MLEAFETLLAALSDNSYYIEPAINILCDLQDTLKSIQTSIETNTFQEANFLLLKKKQKLLQP